MKSFTGSPALRVGTKGTALSRPLSVIIGPVVSTRCRRKHIEVWTFYSDSSHLESEHNVPLLKSMPPSAASTFGEGGGAPSGLLSGDRSDVAGPFVPIHTTDLRSQIAIPLRSQLAIAISLLLPFSLARALSNAHTHTHGHSRYRHQQHSRAQAGERGPCPWPDEAATV